MALTCVRSARSGRCFWRKAVADRRAFRDATGHGLGARIGTFRAGRCVGTPAAIGVNADTVAGAGAGAVRGRCRYLHANLVRPLTTALGRDPALDAVLSSRITSRSRNHRHSADDRISPPTAVPTGIVRAGMATAGLAAGGVDGALPVADPIVGADLGCGAISDRAGGRDLTDLADQVRVHADTR
ncbi:hypothetical protein [Micromonospora sp. LOL_023]|uniref:hypothetical protein n=1 Tax=Micromonospora sp. LOL_023 TaxID=3345418 RepID=UPI003A883DFF